MGTAIARKLQWKISMSTEQKNQILSLMEKIVPALIIGLAMAFVTTTNNKNATVDQIKIHLENLDRSMSRMERDQKEENIYLKNELKEFDNRLRAIELKQ